MRLNVLQIVSFITLLFLCACDIEVPPSTTTEEAPTFMASLQVVDEAGSSLAQAVVSFNEQRLVTDSNGQVILKNLNGPIAAVVSADGYIPEPAIIGWADAEKTTVVKLYSRLNGRRWVMHATGDVMFGRRYENPTTGEPLIPAADPATGALTVVENIAAVYRAADLRTINLETTVCNLPQSAAYPKKRFILNSRPETMSALKSLQPAAMAILKSLQVDAVILANNHTRDYMEAGLEETIYALNDNQIAYQGAAVNDRDAYSPLLLQIQTARVGILAWTSVTGSFVNDNYPLEDAPVPVGLPAEEFWQYEEREWGYSSAGWTVPTDGRRIGTAWRLYDQKESSLSAAERAAVWNSLVAVYPEMQDWVARRGHGGAAMWTTSQATQAIADLKKNVDVVIVQMHSGFQYQEAASDNVKANARQAIDAGADIVICHHPHVLQGVEWYKGHLIVYSLGNFIFDQDFLASFPSAFLRVIWEDNHPIEARLIPLELMSYSPTLVSGAAAEHTLLHLWEISLLKAESQRDPIDNGVKAFAVDRDADTKQARFILNRNSAIITDELPEPHIITQTVSPNEVITLDYAGLVDSQLGLSVNDPVHIDIGRDLFGWGHFEDHGADGKSSWGEHWNTEGTRKQIIFGDAASGKGFLRLTRFNSSDGAVLIRPSARIAMRNHRLYEYRANGSVPLDPEASYSLRFMARMVGTATYGIRLDIYKFDDTNPTEDPESLLLNSVTQPLAQLSGSSWQAVEVPISASLLQSGELSANMLNFYFYLDRPSEAQEVRLDIDDVAFIEWRSAAVMPAQFGLYNFIRNTGSQAVTLRFETLGLADTLH